MNTNNYKPAKYRIEVDEKICALCQSCALFCSMDKWSEVSPELGCMDIDIDYFNGQIHFSTCSQCVSPSCVAVCPVGAIKYDDERGCYAIDQEDCIGCGLCASACPKHAISFNKAKRKSAKCNNCGICVEVCPEHAIKLVQIDKNGRVVKAKK